MKTTLAQIHKQIAVLQAKAEAIRKKEAGAVIARIKEAVAHYGLTAADLGLGSQGARAAAKGRLQGKVSRKMGAPKKKSAPVIRYRDAAGNAWTGHGRRPRWFVEALASGKTPESMRV